MSTRRDATGPILRIAAYEPAPAELADLRAVVVCPRCGADVDIAAPAPSRKGRDVQRAEAAVLRQTDAGPRSVDEALVRASLVWLLRSILEVLDGRRPAAQLDAVTAPVVRRYLSAATTAATAAPGRRMSVLRSLRVCLPAERVAEGAAVIEYAGRVRAVAARFEQPITAHPHTGQVAAQQPGRATSGWRCETFRIL